MMTEKRGLASKSKNSFNNSKIFILAILSILMFAASVSYVVAAPALAPGGNGRFDNTSSGDNFYFSDRTINQTIWLSFNVTYTTAAGGANASMYNVTVNCSGVGDTRSTIINATVVESAIAGDKTVQVVRYNASCIAMINNTADLGSGRPFYPALINITLNNMTDQSGGTAAGWAVNSITVPIIIYNMSFPPMVNTWAQWGPETTNFSLVSDFERINLKFQPSMNVTGFAPYPTGCPESICGWMREFTPVNLINFTQINMTDMTVMAKMPGLMQAIQVTVPDQTARYSAATTRVWFNSSFFSGLDSNATVSLYRIPFKGKPDIVTDSAVGANQTTIVLAYDASLLAYNITFRIYGFSTYNATDVTAPIILPIYPANATAIASFNPRLNFTLNGTGTDINISTLVVNFSGTGISGVIPLTRLNFTCVNDTTGGTMGSQIACALNQAVTNTNTTNGTYTVNLYIEDMGGDAGIRGNYTWTFVSTTIPPTISFTNPASASWNNNSPFLNFTLSFNSTAAISGNGISTSSINVSVFAPSASGVRFNVLGTNESVRLTALANGAFAVFVNFTEAQILPNSSVIIKVAAQDNLTNTLPLTNLSFYSDTNPPVVTRNTVAFYNSSSSTPRINFTVTDTVSINISCNLTIDGGVVNTSIFLNNGSLNGLSAGTALWYYANTTSTLSDGMHDWGIECWDNAFNFNTTNDQALTRRNITVDTAKPTVNGTSILNNTYISATDGVFIVNVTDSPRWLPLTATNNVTAVFLAADVHVMCSYNGGSQYLSAGGPLIAGNLNITNETQFYSIFSNCSNPGVSKFTFSDNENITITLYANDTVDNELGGYVLKWFVDTTAPAITSPTLDKSGVSPSYVQGENLTLTITIADPISGVNTTNVTTRINITGINGAQTNSTNNFRTMALASGNSASGTYNVQFNTSVLAKGNYSITGLILANDKTVPTPNINITDLGRRGFSLNFTVTNAGTGSGPTINKIILNQTVFVLNQTPSLNITLNITDVDNVSAVWVAFSGNTGISNTSNIPVGIIDTFLFSRNLDIVNVTGTATTSVTLTVYANDTLNNVASTTMTLTVRGVTVAVDTMTTAPSSPYQFQSPLNVSADVFAYNNISLFQLNITNVTSNMLTDVLGNMTCIIKNQTSMLYRCWLAVPVGSGTTNITTNETGFHSVAVARLISGAVSAQNVSINYTIAAAATIPIGLIPDTTTLSFIGSSVNYTSDSNGLVILLPNGTATPSVRDSTAGIVTYLPNYNVSSVINTTQLNMSIAVRNYTYLNSLNQTNISTIATNISTVYLLNSSAIYVVVALEIRTPKNDSLFTSLEGTNNNVTIFCSEIGISNCSRMTVYTIAFNASLNSTIGNTWITKERNYSTTNNSLAISGITYSGQMFAVGEPVACTNNGATGTTAVPSTGCVYGETVYTSGYICSGAWSSTVCYTAPAATTTTTTTSTTSSDSTPATNTTPTTSSTYLLGTISSGTERTVSINLAGVPVTSIAITTNTQALNTELKIQQLIAAPTDAGNVPSKVYAYMSVTPKNLAPEIITAAKMSFSVTKSWMTQNGITEDQIVLARYADGKWNELETAILSSDDTTTKYQALTPGFSYFAVTIRSAPLVAPEEQTEVPTKPAEQKETPVEQPPAEEQPPVKESKSWIAWLIAALVVVAGVAGYFIYRNMSEK